MDDLKDRLTDLEIAFSFQRETLDELNRLVMELGRRLDRLERDNSRLRDTVRTLAPDLSLSPDE